jgi:hypothetical protein
VDDPVHAAAVQRLREVMAQWREETADSAPANPSKDGFDRETGERLFSKQDTSFYGTPAGSDRDAARVNQPGPF